MARPLRIEYQGGCYHVINRGNYRRNLFYEQGAAASFETTLGQASERFGWEIHAYVIMRNHFHLAVRLGEPNLSEGMRWLQATWIRRYNRFRGLVGKPFQDRYKALVVAPAGGGFKAVCDYIHLNPVRAKAVNAAEVLTYPWSSLPKWAEKGRPSWLVPETVLGQEGGLPDTNRGWVRYVQTLVERGQREAGRSREALSRGWCIGDADFRAQMKQRMEERGLKLEESAVRGLEPEERRKEREADWEQKLRACALAAGLDPDGTNSKKSAPEKVLLAAMLKQTTPVTNAWLAERLDMGAPASVSQYIRRLSLQDDGPGRVRRLLSRVKP